MTTRRVFLHRLAAAALGSAAGIAFGSEMKKGNDMPATFSKRGIEREEFTDPKTGRTILQLTDNQRWESKHTYYDICPWSPDGKYILFSSADPVELTRAGVDEVGTRNGQVCVLDTETYEITVIAGKAEYSAHVGAFAMWHPLKNTAYYRRGPDEVGVIDVGTGKERVMEGKLRMLSPDGTKFAWTETNWADPDKPETWGVYTMNEDGSDKRRILTVQQLYDITPNRDQFDVSEMTVGNTKWTPDSQHMLIAMWVRPKGHVRRSIYVSNRDGTEVRWLAHFSGHHSWTPDGKHVLFCGYKTVEPDGTRKDRRLFLIEFDGSNRRVVIEEPLGSHPLMDVSGSKIVDYDGQGIYLVRVKEQTVERLAEYRNSFEISHKGTHPHPVWNQEGTQVLYNSGETGHCEIYLIRLED